MRLWKLSKDFPTAWKMPFQLNHRDAMFRNCARLHERARARARTSQLALPPVFIYLSYYRVHRRNPFDTLLARSPKIPELLPPMRAALSLSLSARWAEENRRSSSVTRRRVTCCVYITSRIEQQPVARSVLEIRG